MSEQCWKDYAYPDKRCKNAARWVCPEDLRLNGFMKAVKWCDNHRFPNDVPLAVSRMDATRDEVNKVIEKGTK